MNTINKNNLRTPEQLNDFLQRELSWRRKELSVISRLLRTPEMTPTYRNALIRAGVTVLYSHWEGYVKIAATAYVCFVSTQRLKFKELSPNFLTLSLKTKLDALIKSRDDNINQEIVNFFLTEMDNRSRINWEKVINTEANLSSRVFKRIVQQLELEYLSQYETKQNVIDSSLLKNRNDAAHGSSYLEIDEEQLLELIQIFVGNSDNEGTHGLLQLFYNQISNAVALKEFMIS